jgi:hypothetical protein
LQEHSVLFAEDLPTESYLDTGDRDKFANGGKRLVLFPDFAARTWESAGCAPLVVTGARLDAVRRRINGSRSPAAATAPGRQKPGTIRWPFCSLEQNDDVDASRLARDTKLGDALPVARAAGASSTRS